MSDIVEELRKGVQYDGYSLITEAEDTMNEAADIIDKLVEALEQIIEFRGARTYSGTVAGFDEQYPDVRIAMKALETVKGKHDDKL